MNRPPSRLPPSRFPLIASTLIVLAVAGYFGWRYHQARQAPPVQAPAATAPAEPPVAAASEPAAPPAIQHPVDPPSAELIESPPLPALADADPLVSQLLTEQLGRQNVLTFLQVDGFVRRVVATVDNLPRAQAPVAVWPINPTPQRFTTQQREGGTGELTHPDNSRRYAPLVSMVTAVDTTSAVAAYRRLYPLFQAAYEDLGFPGRYFNDRLVHVLDHLIATPIHPEPLAVTLVEVKGSVPSVRPWVRYEFADPALESLSAGQKILLRVGPENHQRLQAKLKEVRQQVARRP